MDALDVAKVCLRRWYVCVPIVAIAVLAGMQLTSGRLPTYSATGSFALVYTHAAQVGPNQQDPRIANPLVASGPALLKEAVISDLSSTEVQSELGHQGVSGTPPTSVVVGQNVIFGPTFSVDSPRNSQSVVITSYGEDPRAVRATIAEALDAVPRRLAKIQGEFNVPTRAQYTSFVTSTPQMVTYPAQSRMKALVAMAGVGGLAGAALSLLVDRLITRRRQRRALQGSARRRKRGAVDDDDPMDSFIAEGSLR